jgi:hypothetical protein
MVLNLYTAVLFTFATPPPALAFSQNIEIDTSMRVLESTPEYFSSEEALKAHKIYEANVKKGNLDLYRDYYLVFRYRDTTYIAHWLDLVAANPKNPLIKVWMINAISQIGNARYLPRIAPYKSETNAILRECTANAYGFLGCKDSIPSLRKWLSEEKNDYVSKTIEASIAAINAGGYKSRIPYLPVYFAEKPLKLLFLYNRKVKDDPKMHYYEFDTTDKSLKSPFFIFPHQQYLWKLKGAPKRGFFGSKTGSIYHIGMDSGWLLEGLSIHSISDGIVKQISHSLSWGNHVVIETVARNGDHLCIIYGHLSPYNNLRIGDTIHLGDRIGQIGNSVTPENGGYWAHLHLGIEKNEFSRAAISGYDSDTLSYENPIRFIKANEPPSAK